MVHIFCILFQPLLKSSKHKYNSGMKHRALESGAIDSKVIGISVLGVLFIVAGSAAIWAYMNYLDAKSNVDSKVQAAVSEGVKTQSEKDQAEFLAREKEPMRQFAGPDDYGHLTFDYPKTWSAYQGTDVSNGGGATYAAYLSPVTVPPVPANALSDLVASSKETPSANTVSKFALRVKIEQKTYDDSLKTYDPLIKTGQLSSAAFSNGTVSGTRFDGRFNNDIRGSAVVIKMRDRTLTLRTDADVFKGDFDKLIATIKFNQ